jgi:transcriptional regulator with XRE-family HTH domain
MTKLRTVLAENLRTYRNEMGFSQLKLANLVDTAPNYIAMIEAGKRFPTDKMLEKIAVALQREPCELFSIAPLQKHWQESLLADFADFINLKLKTHSKK